MHDTVEVVQDVAPNESPKTTSRNGTNARIAFAVVFAGAFAIFTLTMIPVLPPILLGGLIAAFVAPLYDRLERRTPGRSVAAAAITVGIVVVCVAPLVLLGIVIADRAMAVAARAPKLVEWLSSPDGLGALLEKRPALRWMVPEDLQSHLAKAVTFVANELPAVVDGLARIGLGFFLTMLTMYYLLRDGPWMVKRLVRALPIEPRHTRAILHEFQIVGRAVIVGTLGTAALQGTLSGLCYWALGLPEPLLLGTVTAAVSIVPAVGSSLVWAPLTIFLYASGHPVKGTILLLFGLLVVATVDNIARPLLNERGLGVHPLLVFLGLFGGLYAFGMAGLYLGPLFVSLFVAVARIYEREMSPAATAPVEPRPRHEIWPARLARSLRGRVPEKQPT